MRYVVFAAFTAFAIFMFVHGVKEYFNQRALLSDPRPVEAKVLHSEVQKIESTSSFEDRNGRRKTVLKYRPTVTFEYRVDGRRYESDRIWPADFTHDTDRAEAASVIAPYAKGATVKAFYAPKRPELAFLIEEYTAGPIVFMALGILVPVVVWVVTGYAFK